MMRNDETISKNPSQELEGALHKLHEFTCQNDSSQSLIKFLPTPLKKTIDFAKRVIQLTLWSNKPENTEIQYQHELLRAVEIIRRHYLIIQKMTKGTPTQQKLAETALSTIRNYNQTIVKTISNAEIAQFCKRHLKTLTIDLPKLAFFEMSSTKRFSNRTTVPEGNFKRIGNFLNFSIPELPKDNEIITPQESDAFRMKAITLLRNHGIRFGSVSEELSTLRTSPIQTIFETSSAPIVSMQLVLNPIPGQEIKFKGSFQRDINKTKHSIPIPSSFQLCATSIQTGFPDPSQNNGWALHESLMPTCPASLNQMPLLQSLYERKKYLAAELLPQGKLYMAAKELLHKKKAEFDKEKDRFLIHHRMLAKSIYKAASTEVVEGLNINTIETFFEYLETQFDKGNVFDFICDCYRQISSFISEPHLRLQHELSVNPLETKREGQAKKLLMQEFMKLKNNMCMRIDVEEIIKNFIICMGQLVGMPGQSIILQNYSEYLGQIPFPLNNYEQKILAVAYKQLEEFMIPLEMQTQLESDIKLFEASSIKDLDYSYTRVVHELKVYYNSQCALN